MSGWEIAVAGRLGWRARARALVADMLAVAALAAVLLLLWWFTP